MDQYQWNRNRVAKHQWPLHTNDPKPDLCCRRRGDKVEMPLPVSLDTTNSKRPWDTMSEPSEDVEHGSSRIYAPLPEPSYHGPHFEKAALQAEIRESLNMTGVWHSNMEIQQIPYRPEFRGRAHSIHGPIFHHHHVGHYESLPIPWTKQMEAERMEYKRLDKSCNGAPRTDTTKDKECSLARGQTLARAISLSGERENLVKWALQARLGFRQKFPQAYRENNVKSHDDEIENRKKTLKGLVEKREDCILELNKWETRVMTKPVEQGEWDAVGKA